MRRRAGALHSAAAAFAIAGTAALAAPLDPVGAQLSPPSTAIAALGDSITAGWGSGVDPRGANVPDTDGAASWATGDDPEVGSHYTRLLRLLPGGTALAAVNLARPGASVADPEYGLAAQARELPANVDYVLVGGGSANVCGQEVTTPAALVSPRTFARALRDALDVLRTRLPRVRVFVASVPDWSQLFADEELRNLPRPAYACPLLFGAGATASTAADVANATRGYNAALEGTCAGPAYAAFCRFDGGAANRLRLSLDDLSRLDYFHLSARGQAKLAAATWSASGLGTPEPEPETTRPPPSAEGATPRPAHGPQPQQAAAARRLAVISAAVRVEPLSVLAVAAIDRATGAPLPLVRRSAVGTSVTGILRTTIFNRARGRVVIRLRVPARALATEHHYAIQVTATANGRTTRVVIPFLG